MTTVLGGGGVDDMATATATLTNCTISGNSVAHGGGGLVNYGGANLTSCTVSGNSANISGAGGLANYGTATLVDTIIAAQSKSGDVKGSVSGNFDLVGNGSDETGLANGVNGNLVGTASAPINPRLGILGSSYGGPTETIPLLPGSPAIDSGTSIGAPTTDQRGENRVGAVDIGAFESQGFTLTTAAGSTPQSATLTAPFTTPLSVTVSAKNRVEPVAGGVAHFTAPASAPRPRSRRPRQPSPATAATQSPPSPMRSRANIR